MKVTEYSDTERMRLFKNAKYLVLHAGTFHADDVFTAAYCSLVKEWLKCEPFQIIRQKYNDPITNDMTIENGYIVADIGGAEFDHHKDDSLKEKRSNGVAYASFGLIVKYFHYSILNKDEYYELDESFIQPLDYHDNYGGCGNQLSLAISAFNTNWDDAADRKERNIVEFNEALCVAKKILRNTISHVRSIIRAKKYVEKREIINNAILLDSNVPINNCFDQDPKACYLGHPSNNRGYVVVSIRDIRGKVKKQIPVTPSTFGIISCNPDKTRAVFINKQAAVNCLK